jgi:hypothetical protein
MPQQTYTLRNYRQSFGGDGSTFALECDAIDGSESIVVEIGGGYKNMQAVEQVMPIGTTLRIVSRGEFVEDDVRQKLASIESVGHSENFKALLAEKAEQVKVRESEQLHVKR